MQADLGFYGLLNRVRYSKEIDIEAAVDETRSQIEDEGQGQRREIEENHRNT